MSCLAQGDGVAEAPDREHEAVQWAEAPVAVHSLIRIDEQVAAQLTQFTRVEAHHLLAARWMLQQQVESHALWCEAWLAVSVVCDEWLQHEQPEPCCCADDVWWWWHVVIVVLLPLLVVRCARVLKALADQPFLWQPFLADLPEALGENIWS